MSFGRNSQAQGYQHGGCCPTFDGNNNNGNRKRSRINYYHGNYDIRDRCWAEHGVYSNGNNFDYGNYVQHDAVPSSSKRRKHPTPSWENNQKHYLPSTVQGNIPTTSINFQEPPKRSNVVDTSISPICKLDCSIFEDKEPVFMSRNEIDKCSPSRKDGIDVLHETHLRYSYCAFIQNLGMWLNLPQTTIGTAMVLCHRFFVRRSHACHDRFDWFEKYHDRVLEAELLLLTTLNFELNVQHPYAPLTSILDKLGPSKTILLNLALNLISKGIGCIHHKHSDSHISKAVQIQM